MNSPVRCAPFIVSVIGTLSGVPPARICHDSAEQEPVVCNSAARDVCGPTQQLGMPWNSTQRRGMLWRPAERRGMVWGSTQQRGMLWGPAQPRGMLWDSTQQRGMLWGPAQQRGSAGCCGIQLSSAGYCRFTSCWISTMSLYNFTER